MSLSFEAQFARALYAMIEKELVAHHNRIFSGGMIDLDNANATGMKLAQATGHYAGLKLCLTFMEEVEKRLFGKDRVPKERINPYDV